MSDPTVEDYLAALKPSLLTKAEYMGEFSMEFPLQDEDGKEYMRTINVPWTTIKTIMVAIREHARFLAEAGSPKS